MGGFLMPYTFNPFTGNFDYYASASGGGTGGSGNIFWVQLATTLQINQWTENFVTTPMIIDGTLIVEGRLSVYG